MGKPGCPHGPTCVPKTLHLSSGTAFLVLLPAPPTPTPRSPTNSHYLAKAFGTCFADLPQTVHAGHGVS